MRFYTNVALRGDTVLLKGYNDGRVEREIKYRPYLFLPSKDESEYKTLDGRNVEKMNFSTIREARKFVKDYADVSNFEIFGMNNYIYPFINDIYDEPQIIYDSKKIKVIYLDIEAAFDPGVFPNPELADKEVTAITIGFKGFKIVFGCGDYKEHQSDVKYYKFTDEEALLRGFLEIWEKINPDVVTGWYCLPVNTPIWTKTEIIELKNVVSNSELYDSSIEKIHPITKKQKWDIVLCNGTKISASEDHIFPILNCDPNKYTNLISNYKNKSLNYKDFKVKNIPIGDKSCFMKIVMGNNINIDVEAYRDHELYMAGMIYTDGSLKDKNHPSYGYSLYQKENEYFTKLKNKFDIQFNVTKNIKTDGSWFHSAYINPEHLNKTHDLIYLDNRKRLNLNSLSKLSRRQFLLFLSGLLDGDGTRVNDHGRIGLCNFNGDDINTIEQLCLWNGIFITKSKNIIYLYDLELNELTLLHAYRWVGANLRQLNRDSSQKAKQIKFKKVGNEYYVRIKSITKTEEYCDMMDITTDTHYFIANGIRTHNCEIFDIPYLINRITRILSEDHAKRLSSWGIIEQNEFNDRGKVKKAYKIVGTSILDYIRLYQKFTYIKRESYKLGFIAEVELKETKVDYGEYKNLEDLRKRNFQKYIEYNIHDVTLVERLEKKLGLLEIVYAIAYWGRVNFEDAFSPVRTWDVIIHNYLLAKKIVIPQKKQKLSRELVGAFVKPVQVGQHLWVLSFDLKSLYPHLIMMFNISPEMFRGMVNVSLSIDEILNGGFEKFREKMREEQVAMAANLALFTKEKMGFLPALMHQFYNERDTAKKQMLKVESDYQKTKTSELETEKSRLYNLQMALKILLNSLYGSLANEYFRWYDINLAEAITMSGQLAIKWIESKINPFLNEQLGTKGVDYIIAMDTDSMYINAEAFTKTMGTTDMWEIAAKLDVIGKDVITPFINKTFAELADYTNAYEQSMDMKREAIATKGIWTAKKRYMLNVLYNESVIYKEPELKITGIEAVKSSTPKVCRDAIKDCIKLAMNGTQEDLQAYVKAFKEKFFKMKFEDIASPTSVNNISKYYDPVTIYGHKTPGHTKGALIYNHLLKTLNIKDRQPILDEDKVRYGYIIEPNIHHTDVLSVTDEGIPPEFNLDGFVDYERQFEKAFLNPVKVILNCIGWTTEKQATLRKFFK